MSPNSPKQNQDGSERDRRTALLDATLRLIGEGGLRAVTHRAVEREAGLLHGSTTYYFGTRDQLVAAAVERLVDLDRRRTERLAHDLALALARSEPRSRVDQLLSAVVRWIDEDRETQLARYELELAGARDPQLRRLMSSGSSFFWRLVEPIAIAVGSEDPPRDARMIVAMLDGLLMDRITHDPPDPQLVVDGFRRALLSIQADQASRAAA